MTVNAATITWGINNMKEEKTFVIMADNSWGDDVMISPTAIVVGSEKLAIKTVKEYNEGRSFDDARYDYEEVTTIIRQTDK